MGAGTDVIKVRGVQRLRGGSYSIIPDQIEAGTYMAAVAAAGGELLVKNVIPKHLDCISAKLVEMGVDVEEQDDAVLVRRSGPITRTNVKTMPYPGFPTDMQPQIAAVLCLAQGTSVLTEGVWDNRYRYVDEFRRMGAKIQVDGRWPSSRGPPLTGAPVHACDLRAGAAMVIAGLAAQGTTEIDGGVPHRAGLRDPGGEAVRRGGQDPGALPARRRGPDPGGLTFAHARGRRSAAAPASRPGGATLSPGRRHMEVCTLASGSSGIPADLLRLYLCSAGRGHLRPPDHLCPKGAGGRSHPAQRVLVTHEHTDHVSGLATLTKQLGCPFTPPPPLWTAWAKSPSTGAAGPGAGGRHWLPAGELGGVLLHPHDAAGSVGYAVTGGGARMALATDLGHLTPQVWDAARGADLLVCETNHDEDWVRSGPIPTP